MFPFSRNGSGALMQGIYDRFAKQGWRQKWLLRTIKALKPDIIHSLEFQSGAYLCLDVQRVLKDQFPVWIATNWGSDIQLFSQLKAHRDKISTILQTADYYSAECRRDYCLAKELEMTASPLPVIPNAGGFDLEKVRQKRQKNPIVGRNIFLVKGHQGLFGRALDALKMIEAAAPRLPKGIKVVVYSASPEIVIAGELVQNRTGIEFEFMPIHKPVSHDTITDLFSRARAYLGVSISDGISTSMLEAMAYGAVPIQTCTACANEWIEDGISGFIARPDDVEGTAVSIVRAMTDDHLAQEAFKLNWETLCQRASDGYVRKVANSFYDTAYVRRMAQDE
tara:strand:+ start:17096 stop:18106 length:1011 start_codon:yes stop_codon:yes gene_type:complete